MSRLRVCLNVQALTGRVTGIERYTFEVLRELDALVAEQDELEVEAVYARGAHPHLPELKAISAREAPCWRAGLDYAGLRRFLRQRDAFYVNFSGGLAVQPKSVITFHDLRPITHPEYDGMASRARVGLSVRAVRAQGCPVVTVSPFSQDELQWAGIQRDRITLASNGWEHMRRIEADKSLFEERSDLVPGEYYYVLGSLAPHKNLSWVLGVARNNPNCTIAVAGKLWDGTKPPQDLPSNVRYLGYVSDGQSKALLESCRAFLHPSRYEGFGLPPLEALACGKRVLAAAGTAVGGIYGNALRYFDADDVELDLDRASDFEPSAQARDRVLSTYTWHASAQTWMDLLVTLR